MWVDHILLYKISPKSYYKLIALCSAVWIIHTLLLMIDYLAKPDEFMNMGEQLFVAVYAVPAIALMEPLGYLSLGGVVLFLVILGNHPDNKN